MIIFFYVVVKFAIYTAVCGWSGRLFNLRGKQYLGFAVGWGSLRLLLGLVFGLPIAALLATLGYLGVPLALNYLLSFGLPRYLEWSILYWAITERHAVKFDRRIHFVVCAGVVASFLIDMAVQVSGVEIPKFFC